MESRRWVVGVACEGDGMSVTPLLPGVLLVCACGVTRIQEREWRDLDAGAWGYVKILILVFLCDPLEMRCVSYYHQCPVGMKCTRLNCDGSNTFIIDLVMGSRLEKTTGTYNSGSYSVTNTALNRTFPEFMCS